MDLSVFEIATDGVPLHLQHPLTGEPLYADEAKTQPITVALVGLDSPEYTAHQRSMVDKRLSPDNKKKISAAQIDDEALRGLAVCIKGWTGFIANGEPVQCTEDAKMSVLKRYPHLKRQIDAFVAKSENFLKVSRQS